MNTLAGAGTHVIRLSAKHDVDPFAVVGLLALHALVEVDFPKLRLWKDVANWMRGSQAV